ncbi:unnamed protein product, partial [Meganyctiphanes norvegica]
IDDPVRPSCKKCVCVSTTPAPNTTTTVIPCDNPICPFNCSSLGTKVINDPERPDCKKCVCVSTTLAPKTTTESPLAQNNTTVKPYCNIDCGKGGECLLQEKCTLNIEPVCEEVAVCKCKEGFSGDRCQH